MELEEEGSEMMGMAGRRGRDDETGGCCQATRCSVSTERRAPRRAQHSERQTRDASASFASLAGREGEQCGKT